MIFFYKLSFDWIITHIIEEINSDIVPYAHPVWNYSHVNNNLD